MKCNVTKGFLVMAVYCATASLPVFSQDFEVAPVVMNFSLEPGEKEAKTATILNHSDKPQSFAIGIENPGIENSNSKQSRSCADWLSVNPSFFEINPNETKTIEVILQVPSDGYSTRWARIYVKAIQERTSLAADKIVSTGITISPRITINVYQSPKSNTKYKAGLSKFIEVTKAQDTVRVFAVSVDNIGDKKLDCNLYLIASNLETAEEYKSSPLKSSLLPDQSKIVKLNLPQGLAPGAYSLAVILDYGHRTNLEAAQLQIQVE